MQLIEVSAFGVRSAQIWLSRRDTPLRFVLFPMVHLGTAEYYQEVLRRMRSCHLVVAEGVSGRSLAMSALTSVYRIAGRSRRLGLTSQHLDLHALGVPIINPDLTGEQFQAGWERVPILFRLATYLLAPILGIWMAIAGSRTVLAKYLEMDDLPTREEMETAPYWEQLDSLVLDKRDELLLRCLDSIHNQRSHEALDVAVVYGADHMRAVVRYLSNRYRYFAKDAEWMTVFPL